MILKKTFVNADEEKTKLCKVVDLLYRALVKRCSYAVGLNSSVCTMLFNYFCSIISYLLRIF